MNTTNSNPLNFPSYQFRIKQGKGTRYIFDISRKKYIALTMEEWVRQHLINFLFNDLKVPLGLIGTEVSFSFNGVNHRADVVVYNRKGKPLMIAECKAPGVEISDTVVEQICNYNYALNAKYLVLTNGIKHHILELGEAGKWIALNNFPELASKI